MARANYPKITPDMPNLYLIRSEGESVFVEADPPRPEAYVAQIKAIDVRYAPHGIPDDWERRGFNHRAEGQFICRDLGWDLAWAILIPDMKAFMRVNKHCILNVTTDMCSEQWVEIVLI
jgi:hypothetical protein